MIGFKWLYNRQIERYHSAFLVWNLIVIVPHRDPQTTADVSAFALPCSCQAFLSLLPIILPLLHQLPTYLFNLLAGVVCEVELHFTGVALDVGLDVDGQPEILLIGINFIFELLHILDYHLFVLKSQHQQILLLQLHHLLAQPMHVRKIPPVGLGVELFHELFLEHFEHLFVGTVKIHGVLQPQGEVQQLAFIVAQIFGEFVDEGLVEIVQEIVEALLGEEEFLQFLCFRFEFVHVLV